MGTLKKHLIVIIYTITAICLLVACLKTDVSQTVDISFGDSYTIIAQKHILLVLSVLFFLFTLITLVFQLFNHPLIKGLFWAHYLLTLIGLVSLRYILLIALPPKGETDYSLPENIDEAVSQTNDWKTPILIICSVLVIAQALFVINMIISIFRKRAETN
jgi:heme/copper-type cytochrome/quinol oxidase subunit 1